MGQRRMKPGVFGALLRRLEFGECLRDQEMSQVVGLGA
jgi:hypothetical protein